MLASLKHSKNYQRAIITNGGNQQETYSQTGWSERKHSENRHLSQKELKVTKAEHLKRSPYPKRSAQKNRS